MFKASQICKYLDIELIGNDVNLIKVTCTSDLQENSLYFCKDFQFAPKKFPKNVFGIVSMASGDYISGGSYAISSDPRNDFVKVVNKFLKPQDNDLYKTVNSKQVNISSEANIENNVVIESFCTILKGAQIGAGCHLQPGVWIGENVVIGNNCHIKANTVIGGDGFGYENDDAGFPQKFLHFGSVEIGNNVDIGSNCTIDRGTLSNTKIGSFVKIDNQVHIGHNCIIGDCSILTPSVTLSGGVIIGKSCWIGPNASILQKIKIDDNSFIGIGAIVINELKKNDHVIGLPASQPREIGKISRIGKNSKIKPKIS